MKTVSFFLCFFLVYGLINVLVRDAQPYYQNREYPMWKHVDQLCRQKETINDKAIVMIGDSRAKAMFLPRTSGEVNLSIGGSTPIEGYYSLKNAFRSGQRNRVDGTLLLSYAPFHLRKADCFFARTMVFGYLDLADYLAVYQNDILDHPEYFKKKPTDFIFYLITPWYHLDALKNGIEKKRWIPNSKVRKYVETHHGQCYFGRRTNFKHAPQLIGSFAPSPLSTRYFTKIKTISRTLGFKTAVYVNTPFPNARRGKAARFIDSYGEYIRSQGFNQLLPITFCPDNWFGDPSHLYSGYLPYTRLIHLKMEALGQEMAVPYPDAVYPQTTAQKHPLPPRFPMKPHGVELNLARSLKGKRLHMTVDREGIYYVEFRNHRGPVYGLVLDKTAPQKNGLSIYNLSLEDIAFDRIYILPVDSEHPPSHGQLFVTR